MSDGFVCLWSTAIVPNIATGVRNVVPRGATAASRSGNANQTCGECVSVHNRVERDAVIGLRGVEAKRTGGPRRAAEASPVRYIKRLAHAHVCWHWLVKVHDYPCFQPTNKTNSKLSCSTELSKCASSLAKDFVLQLPSRRKILTPFAHCSGKGETLNKQE